MGLVGQRALEEDSLVDTARQTLRYGIPGAIALAWATISYAVVGSVGDKTLSEALVPVSETVNAAVAILATIPTGWLCYQVYYFSYRPLVLLRWGPWVRRDRGAEILEQLTQAQMARVAQLFPGDGVAVPYKRPYQGKPKLSTLLKFRSAREELGLPARVQRDAFRRQWHANWDVVRGLMNLIADDNGAELKAEATALGDVYHGIGASRFAMYGGLLAGSGYSAYQVLGSGHPTDKMSATFAVLLLVTAIFGSILHRVRRHTWRRWVATLGRGLRLYFAAHPDILRDAAARVVEEGYQNRPAPIGDP